MSGSATSFASLLCCWLAASAWAQSPPVATRGHGPVPEEYARAGDALVAVLFPGATRDWDDGRLVWPDGRREALSLSGLTRLRVGDTWWIAAGVDFPDKVAREIARLETLRAPGELVRSRVVVLRADGEFRPQDWREVEVDSESQVSQVHQVEILPPEATGGWPRLRVTATSAALEGEASMKVSWIGTLDTDSRSWLTRLPRAYQERRSGGRIREDAVQARPEDGRTRFYGVATGEALGPACPEPCRRRPLSLLGGMPVP